MDSTKLSAVLDFKTSFEKQTSPRAQVYLKSKALSEQEDMWSMFQRFELQTTNEIYLKSKAINCWGGGSASSGYSKIVQLAQNSS